MAMVAEEEGRMISERTKAALAAARRRGVQLGGYNKNPKLTVQARKAGQEANARTAAERATVIGPMIAELQAAGAASLRAIAAGLNERGIPTARGTGTWSATQVMRVLARWKWVAMDRDRGPHAYCSYADVPTTCPHGSSHGGRLAPRARPAATRHPQLDNELNPRRFSTSDAGGSFDVAARPALFPDLLARSSERRADRAGG
jgi:hypothetical protein